MKSNAKGPAPMSIGKQRLALRAVRALPSAGMIAIVLFGFTGCLQDSGPSGSTKNPTDSLPTTKPSDSLPWPADPALFHSGITDTLWPLETVSESVYVRGGKPGKWNIYLEQGPTGTSFANGRIYYRPPEGLQGPQAVRVMATLDTAMLESTWTVAVRPAANQPPYFLPHKCPQWVVAGRTVRLPFHAVDPEGQALHFVTRLPAGAVYADSFVEWTPTAAQKGTWGIAIFAYDSRGASLGEEHCSIDVRDPDPVPYAPVLSVGRAWWIRGYLRDSSASRNDSVNIRRRLTLVTADSVLRTFTVRAQDTLSGSRNAIRDTVFSCRLPIEGALDCGMNNVEATLPFPIRWAENATVNRDTLLSLSGIPITGRRYITPSTCINGGGSKYGCGGGEYLFGLGWGVLLHQWSSASLFSGSISRSADTVWAVAQP